ncbi:beta strand repeat-containing protein, partial [Flavobacterium sp.]|uniref:beta strand repeat-containing protein n=1 Tax=Flavobacterium sp. TaxID=239 RepID=UPI002F043B15
MPNFTFAQSKFFRLNLFVLLLISSVSFAQVCGTPGADGPVNVSTSINTYYPIATSSNLSLPIDSKSITLGAVPATDSYGNNFGATQISAGDLVLIMQMQDATINYTNSSVYGSGSATSGPDNAGGTGFTNAGNSGVYEYVIATNNVPLTGGVLNFTGTGSNGGTFNSYVNAPPTTTSGKKTFQVIRVPQFSNLTLSSNITTPPFNGVAGGIIAFNVSGTFNFNGFTIDGSARGFRGGFSPVANTGVNNSDTYVGLSTNTVVSGKGEGIAGTPKYMWDGFNEVTIANEGLPNGSAGRGAPANAGGGGNDHNSGGGGGGNGGYGGLGGKGWQGGEGALSPATGGGRPGFTSYIGSTPILTRLIMGGGGGAGDANNAINGVKGGVGGAIILINAGNIQGTGIIRANGGDGAPGSYAGAPDGAGGGGAGGTVFLNISNQAPIGTNINIQANGGKGGNTLNDAGNSHGPGGGGGGGIIRYKVPGTGVTITTSVAGGASGKTDNGNGEDHGAQPGVLGYVASFNSSDVPAYLQINSNCLATLNTTVKSVTKSVCNKINETVSYEIEITNTGSGNAAQVRANFAFPTGINFDSATATYTGNASGPTGALPNTGTGATAVSPIFGGFNIPLNGVVKITLIGKVVSSLAAGPLSANAQALYLDPTRTTSEPNRMITPAINSFGSKNTTYQTGGGLAVLGSNFSGSTSTADDIAVKPTPAKPTISNGGSLTFCQGGSVVLTSSAGTSYQWSNGLTTQSITVSTSGDYSVQVTNSDGCQSVSSDNTTVTVIPNPSAPTATAQSFCSADNSTVANLVPSGSSYKWYSASTGGTALAGTTVLATGNYFVSQTTNGCESTRTSVAVTVNTNPVMPTLSTVTQPTCGTPTGSFTITNYNSLYTYSITPIGATLNTTTGVVTGTKGIYKLTATLNNCTSDFSNSVEINSEICAVDDDSYAVQTPGTSTAVAVGNVRDNDTLNGVSASSTNTVITAVTTGPLSISANGDLTLAPNTTSGTYKITYQLCEAGTNSTNCDTAEATVVVKRVIDAVDDNSYAVQTPGTSTAVAVGNVRDNDTLNGVSASSTNTVITAVTTGPLSISANGDLTLAPNTTSGTYKITYQLCEAGTNSTNCDTAEATVVVKRVIDAVDDDSYAVQTPGTSTAVAVGNVRDNDKLNGVSASSTNTVITAVTTGPLSISANGDLTLAPNTTSGTYKITYQLCEAGTNSTNCDTAEATVVVKRVIDAVDDDSYAVQTPGTSTAVAVGNVRDNDKLNGVSASSTNTVITAVTTGPLSISANGDLTLAPNTTSGTYKITYQLCEAGTNSTNCDTAEATVVVKRVIDAVVDTITPINGNLGGTTVSLIDNDKLNGNQAVIGTTPGEVSISIVGTLPIGLTLNTDGTITVAPNTPATNYNIEYTICEVGANPSNCDSVTIVVPVTVGDLVANPDPVGSVIGSNTPQTLVNVLENDTKNGTKLDPSDVTLSVSTPDPKGYLTLNPDGTVTLGANPLAGDYELTYTICEKLNAGNCKSNTVTVTVGVPVIDAVVDTITPINGNIGGTTVSLTANDTLNGKSFVLGTNPGEVTLNIVGALPAGLTLNA